MKTDITRIRIELAHDVELVDAVAVVLLGDRTVLKNFLDKRRIIKTRWDKMYKDVYPFVSNEDIEVFNAKDDIDKKEAIEALNCKIELRGFEEKSVFEIIDVEDHGSNYVIVTTVEENSGTTGMVWVFRIEEKKKHVFVGAMFKSHIIRTYRDFLKVYELQEKADKK